MRSITREKDAPDAIAFGNMGRRRPWRDADHLDVEVGATCGKPDQIGGDNGRDVVRRVAKRPHGAAQESPALPAIDGEEGSPDPVILDEVERGWTMRRPWREVGVKGDVDAVIDIRLAEHFHAELLPDGTMGAIGGDDIGRAH